MEWVDIAGFPARQAMQVTALNLIIAAQQARQRPAIPPEAQQNTTFSPLPFPETEGSKTATTAPGAQQPIGTRVDIRI
jgi:hypothetical protein